MQPSAEDCWPLPLPTAMAAQVQSAALHVVCECSMSAASKNSSTCTGKQIERARIHLLTQDHCPAEQREEGQATAQPRDDDVLPDSLGDALDQGSSATSDALQRGANRCIVSRLTMHSGGSHGLCKSYLAWKGSLKHGHGCSMYAAVHEACQEPAMWQLSGI